MEGEQKLDTGQFSASLSSSDLLLNLPVIFLELLGDPSLAFKSQLLSLDCKYFLLLLLNIWIKEVFPTLPALTTMIKKVGERFLSADITSAENFSFLWIFKKLNDS